MIIKIIIINNIPNVISSSRINSIILDIRWSEKYDFSFTSFISNTTRRENSDNSIKIRNILNHIKTPVCLYSILLKQETVSCSTYLDFFYQFVRFFHRKIVCFFGFRRDFYNSIRTKNKWRCKIIAVIVWKPFVATLLNRTNTW